MTLRIDLPLGLSLELDVEEGNLDGAWWTWCGITFAEALVGLA